MESKPVTHERLKAIAGIYSAGMLTSDQTMRLWDQISVPVRTKTQEEVERETAERELNDFLRAA